ncbi:hypothetical protein M569_08864, partial [Genlisea aurea]
MNCSAQLTRRSFLTPSKSALITSSSSTPTPFPALVRRDFISCSLLLGVYRHIYPLPLLAEPPPPDGTTQLAFLDVSIDGEPAGRIVIGLYGDTVPAGTSRFVDLVSGRSGVSYRRKEFVKITPKYVQHGGLRSFGVDAEIATKTGSSLAAEDALLEEWKKQSAVGAARNTAKSVSIIVRDPTRPPPKLKLVARRGRLEIDEESVGSEPNGTEFAIAVRDSPELDAASLVIGRVLQGMEVVERISQVKTVQENSSSPYFRVAKLIGDKRAVVAERGFNRPYSKVLITNCGLL